MEAVCPKCKARYELPESQMGNYFVCIECRNKFIIGVTPKKSGGKIAFALLLFAAAFAAVLFFVLKDSDSKTAAVISQTADASTNDPELRYKDLCTLITAGDLDKLDKMLRKTDFAIGKYPEPLLCVALKARQNDAARLLVTSGADVREAGKSGLPVTIAAENGDLEILKFLHQKGAELDATSNRTAALGIAAGNGSVDMVRYILAESPRPLQEPNVSEKAIFIAIRNKQIECVRELLNYYDKGVTDNNGNTLLLAAIQSCDFTVLSLVKKYDDNTSATNDRGEGVIFAALKTNDPAVINLFRNEKVDAMFRNMDGVILPMVCARHQNFLWLKKTLNDDNKNLRDNSGRNVLFYAVMSGNRNIVEYLIKQGVEKGAGNFMQYPFYAALQKGDLILCRSLAADNLELTDDKGNTPLMIASANGSDDIVEWLLSRKCDLNKRNVDGKNAIDLARANNRSEVASMLRRAMQDEEYRICAAKTANIMSSNFSVNDKIASLTNLKSGIKDNPRAEQYIADNINKLREQETARQTQVVHQAIIRSSKRSLADAISELEQVIRENPMANNLSSAKSRLANYREQHRREQERLAEHRRRREKINNMPKSQIYREVTTLINSWLSDMRLGNDTEKYWTSPVLVKTLFSLKSWEILTPADSMSPWVNNVKILADSSNKGGSPIRVTWTVYMRRNESTFEWQIYMLTE